MKRRILGITAIRSEYFFQRPIFEAIRQHPDLNLELIVTGAHLSPLHGYTIKEVETDGFPVRAQIDSLLYSDHDASRLKGAALQLSSLIPIVDTLRPDWLLVPADREEAITMALCGAYMNIATAHYSAGDRVVGNVDDTVRQAVSRLSHLLLTTSEDSRQRLIRAGEEEWRVHNVGHAGLDRIRTTPQLSSEKLAEALGVSQIEKSYVVVVQHSISSELDQASFQMRETLEAIVQLKIPAFVSYPNSDPGSQQIVRVIEEFAQHPYIRAFRSIPDIPFVNLLRRASALVGNSSMGVLEAAFLRLPVINVGRRQTARFHDANIFFVDHDRHRIAAQLRDILENDEVRRRAQNCSNPFGDGHTGERVEHLLAVTPMGSSLLNKDLTY